jgi:hypothetical protein
MIRLHRFIRTRLADRAFTLVDFHCYLSLLSLVCLLVYTIWTLILLQTLSFPLTWRSWAVPGEVQPSLPLYHLQLMSYNPLYRTGIHLFLTSHDPLRTLLPRVQKVAET